MTHEEITDQIVALLRPHDKHDGHFHQEPYKSDFFRLFVFANERGAGLKAARLHTLIAARAPEVFDGANWPCSTPRGRSGNTRGRGSNSVRRWTTIYPVASPP